MSQTYMKPPGKANLKGKNILQDGVNVFDNHEITAKVPRAWRLPILFAVAALVIWVVYSTISGPIGWWKKDWSERKKIVLDISAAGVTDSVGNASVLIRLHDGNFDFTAAKDDGSDIRFIAADNKTLLPYHIEKYDALMNEAYVWVKVPEVKPGAKTVVWIYYGNNKAEKVANSGATYDSDTMLVYHFAEGASPVRDYSANSNNAQNTAIPSQGSFIGAGLRLDEQSSVNIPVSPTMMWTNGMGLTWSAWIKPTNLQVNQVLFSRREGGNSFVIGLDNGIPFASINSARSLPGAPIIVNTWHHLAVVADNGKVTLYLDGESYVTFDAQLPSFNSEMQIGGGFVGEMDEMTISRTARSASFVKFMALEQQGGEKAAKLLSITGDQHSGGGEGYMGIILKSVTFDGWVIISICIAMAIISWAVMIKKNNYLNELGKGNAIFMEEWRNVATDLTELDDENTSLSHALGNRLKNTDEVAMQQSSVYRIYHIGTQQVRQRLDASGRNGSRKVLSTRSIEAIRACLDTGLVREVQKLNHMMVLLTIAISGGPFLGLLGTVVGVMITFAAIAAAGDVNVNAIAPGIAAALVATVAGLAVAIPALFGYNYLVTRVKEATSDMQVFVDEFVTKMAELYCEKAD